MRSVGGRVREQPSPLTPLHTARAGLPLRHSHIGREVEEEEGVLTAAWDTHVPRLVAPVAAVRPVDVDTVMLSRTVLSLGHPPPSRSSSADVAPVSPTGPFGIRLVEDSAWRGWDGARWHCTGRPPTHSGGVAAGTVRGKEGGVPVVAVSRTRARRWRAAMHSEPAAGGDGGATETSHVAGEARQERRAALARRRAGEATASAAAPSPPAPPTLPHSKTDPHPLRTPTARHQLTSPARAPRMTVVMVDARYALVSYVRGESSPPAGVAAEVRQGYHLRDGGDGASGREGIVLVRTALDGSDDRDDPHGAAAAPAVVLDMLHAQQRAGHNGEKAGRAGAWTSLSLPLASFTGFVRDYTEPNMRYNAAVIQELWAEKTRRYRVSVGLANHASGEADEGRGEDNRRDAQDPPAARSLDFATPATLSEDDGDEEQRRRRRQLLMWEEEAALEAAYAPRWSHRFLVSDERQHAIWALQVIIEPRSEGGGGGGGSVRVVTPTEFFDTVTEASLSRGDDSVVSEAARDRSGTRSGGASAGVLVDTHDKSEATAADGSPSPAMSGAGSAPASALAPTPGRPRGRNGSASAAAAEQVPTPILGGARGFVDGHFSIARFCQPTAMCWRYDSEAPDRTSATPSHGAMKPTLGHAHCHVLFISDAGNHAIRQADFATRVVRTVVGVHGVPGYRDGSCATSMLAEATALAWCSSGLVFSDGPNAVLRLVTGIGESHRTAPAISRRRELPFGQEGEDTVSSGHSRRKGLMVDEEDEPGPDELAGVPAGLEASSLRTTATAVRCVGAAANALSDSPPSDPQQHDQQQPSLPTSPGACARGESGRDESDIASTVTAPPRVWTIAGAHSARRVTPGAPTTPPTDRAYVDSIDANCAFIGYPSDIAIVDVEGRPGAAAVLFTDRDGHAVRVLDDKGVRTLVGPLDYSGLPSHVPAHRAGGGAGTIRGEAPTTGDGVQDTADEVLEHSPVLPAGLVYPTQLIACSLVTERAPLLFHEGAGAAVVAATPVPYLHSARPLFLVGSATTGALSLLLPVAESVMECVARTSEEAAGIAAGEEAVTLAGQSESEDGSRTAPGPAEDRPHPSDASERFAAAVVSMLRLGLATEGRRTIGEPGMPALRRLVLPLDPGALVQDTGSSTHEDARTVRGGEARDDGEGGGRDESEEGPAGVTGSPATTDTFTARARQELEAQAARLMAEQYVRLRFPGMLPPPTPQTDASLRTLSYHVSGGTPAGAHAGRQRTGACIPSPGPPTGTAARATLFHKAATVAAVKGAVYHQDTNTRMNGDTQQQDQQLNGGGLSPLTPPRREGSGTDDDLCIDVSPQTIPGTSRDGAPPAAGNGEGSTLSAVPHRSQPLLPPERTVLGADGAVAATTILGMSLDSPNACAGEGEAMSQPAPPPPLRCSSARTSTSAPGRAGSSRPPSYRAQFEGLSMKERRRRVTSVGASEVGGAAGEAVVDVATAVAAMMGEGPVHCASSQGPRPCHLSAHHLAQPRQDARLLSAAPAMPDGASVASSGHHPAPSRGRPSGRAHSRGTTTSTSLSTATCVYDRAVAKLFAVFEFVARKHVEHRAVAPPRERGAVSGGGRGGAAPRARPPPPPPPPPLTHVEWTVTYTLSHMALLRLLFHTRYLDLPLGLARTVASGGDASPLMALTEAGELLLPISPHDWRSVVAMLHACITVGPSPSLDMTTTATATTTTTTFAAFRRLILLLALWEEEGEAVGEQLTLRSGETGSDVACHEPPSRAQCGGPPRATNVSAATMRFGCIDGLPALDALSEEWVVAAYTEAYERALRWVPGFHARQLRHASAHPRGGPRRAHEGDGARPAAEERMVDTATSLEVSPIPHTTPRAQAGPSPADAAIDTVLRLLDVNERSLRELFCAYGRRARVRRSRRYRTPTVATTTSPAPSPIHGEHTTAAAVRAAMCTASHAASPQDLYWKLRQLFATSAVDSAAAHETVSVGVTVMPYAAFQSLFTAVDAYPTLVNHRMLRQAFSDALHGTLFPLRGRRRVDELHPSTAEPGVGRRAVDVVGQEESDGDGDGGDDARAAALQTLEVVCEQQRRGRAHAAAPYATGRTADPNDSNDGGGGVGGGGVGVGHTHPDGSLKGGRVRQGPGRPTATALSTAAVPHAEAVASALAEGGALTFPAFVEAFVRVALAAFSTGGTADSVAYPTAASKLRALLTWLNKQVVLGLVQARQAKAQAVGVVHRGAVRGGGGEGSMATPSTYTFPAALTLFQTLPALGN